MTYNESVLVIPKQVLPEPNSFTKSRGDFKNLVNIHGSFLDRNIAETDPNFLQIIPYILVEDVSRIFRYQRLKSGSESRLHNKYSVGLGGHVNQSDQNLDTANSFFIPAKTIHNAIVNCAYRELQEELNIDMKKGTLGELNTGKFLIYDDSNDVGKVHLGVLYIFQIHDYTYSPSVRETTKIAGEMIKRSNLQLDTLNYENWSRIALE